MLPDKFLDDLVAIYHAAEEGDVERLEDLDREGVLDRLISESKQLEPWPHPPIFPERSAKRLKRCIEKRDRLCIFEEISSLSIYYNLKKVFEHLL